MGLGRLPAGRQGKVFKFIGRQQAVVISGNLVKQQNKQQMTDTWTERWNARYGSEEFAYGIHPNHYLEEQLSKNHLNYVLENEKVGGPKDIDSLFSIEEIKSDFPNYEFEELKEMEIELNEGLYNNGTGSVIRFVGRKK